MEVRIGREYWRQSRLESTKLQKSEVDRCMSAVHQFRRYPRNPGLNFERLGRGTQNHWSIRASRELRVILAVEFEGDSRRVCAPVNMGHHDPMCAWSQRQRFHTDLSGPEVFRPEVDFQAPGDSPRSAGRRLEDFEEWMLFLSAGQRRLVVCHHAGAARVPMPLT